MDIPNQPASMLHPRLGALVTTWTHENGAQHAVRLPGLFPKNTLQDLVKPVVNPTVLENEKEIPAIADCFASKGIDALLIIRGNIALDRY